MKKSLLFLSLLSASVYMNAQVGINNATPNSTLDVVAKSVNTSNEIEGLLVPRVSINKALLMGLNSSAIKESTLIYVNDLSDSTVPANATNSIIEKITANGFYSWNGSQWIKHLTGDEGSKWINNTSNATVSLKNLSNGTTARTENTNLFINDNGNVGIGTSNPSVALDIAGNVKVRNINANTGATSDKVVVTDSNGVLKSVDKSSLINGSESIIINNSTVKRAALTGDVTAAENSNVTTISNNAVTTEKIANNTIKAEDWSQMNATKGQVMVWDGKKWSPNGLLVLDAPITTLTCDANTRGTSIVLTQGVATCDFASIYEVNQPVRRGFRWQYVGDGYISASGGENILWLKDPLQAHLVYLTWEGDITYSREAAASYESGPNDARYPGLSVLSKANVQGTVYKFPNSAHMIYKR